MNVQSAWKKPILWLMVGGVGTLALALMLVSLTLERLYFGGEIIDLEQDRVHQEAPTPEVPPLRLAVATMFSPTHTYVHYVSLAEQIGEAVGLESTLIVRPSYQELREVMDPSEVDVAFVCTGPYALMVRQKQAELLVQPKLREGLTDHSALIVPAGSDAMSIGDLRGKTIAYSDPESHTGCFVLRHELDARGFKPDTYFSKVLFTGSHDRSVEAVTGGFVDGAAVHSMILDGLLREDPELAGKVRVIWRSTPFGPPPVVVPLGLDPELKQLLRDAFLKVHLTEEGTEALQELGVVRFELPRPQDYDGVLEMYRTADHLLPPRIPGS